ncbi:sensor domain-containing diguanylate cyclase [Pollutimonas bauzanensis]|uniref:GGDEF domain-containing protein n=1 Tax=Pollutimonas bauzanensis TaxID=658167 RepID=UPI00333ECCE1
MLVQPHVGAGESSPGMRYAMVCAIVVALALIIIVAWGAWSSRQHQLRDKEAATLDLARTLGQHAYATIKQADIVLFGLVERLETEGMGDRQLKRLQVLLRNQRAQLPQLHGLFVYDNQGRWLVNSNEIIPGAANNSDRGYFVFHKDHARAGAYIGPPLRSRSTGAWILTVSRRINHPDGSFAGVALATLDLNYFLELYNTLEIGKDGLVNLLLKDGTILVRRPFNDREVGLNVSQGALFTDHLNVSQEGIATSYSVVDKIQRILGFTHVKEYPLAVVVGRDKQEILAGWRKESMISAAIVSFFILLLAYLGSRLIAMMRYQLRVEKNLRHAQESLVSANKALGLLAREDGLTGLANRREFDISLVAEFQRASRYASPVSLLMLDVDFFKQYNDYYGHGAGDECLKSVAQIIKAYANRPADLAARYGGEEFVVILPDTDVEGAFYIAEKMRGTIEEKQMVHAVTPNGVLTVSIGVAVMVPRDGDTPTMLTAAADKALYEAKKGGRNQVFSA